MQQSHLVANEFQDAVVARAPTRTALQAPSGRPPAAACYPDRRWPYPAGLLADREEAFARQGFETEARPCRSSTRTRVA